MNLQHQTPTTKFEKPAPPIAYIDELEYIRQEIKFLDAELEKMQREHIRLTGERYKWFK